MWGGPGTPFGPLTLWIRHPLPQLPARHEYGECRVALLLFPPKLQRSDDAIGCRTRCRATSGATVRPGRRTLRPGGDHRASRVPGHPQAGTRFAHRTATEEQRVRRGDARAHRPGNPGQTNTPKRLVAPTLPVPGTASRRARWPTGKMTRRWAQRPLAPLDAVRSCRWSGGGRPGGRSAWSRTSRPGGTARFP